MSEAAAEAAADLVAGAARIAEAPEEGEQPTEEATTTTLPDFEADLTGIEDILEDVPDDDEDVELPPVAEEESYDEYDPDQLQKKLKALEKKNAWLEEQRVTQGRKNWKAEAARRFPLADVDDIAATSRRGFLKQAAAQHDRYSRKLKPILSQLDELKGRAIETVKEETRAETEAAWGRPSAGPSQPLTETAAQGQSQLDRRRYGSVKEMVAARFQHDDRFKEGV